MDKSEAYKIVYDDIINSDVGIFKGVYDASHETSEYFEYGVMNVMEFIASNVSEECLNSFSEIFVNNMVESQKKVSK